MIANYYLKYCEELQKTLSLVKAADLDSVMNIIWRAYAEDKKVYVIGNGGSAATASHIVCDLVNSARVSGKKRMRIMSLTDNIAHMTAISNDVSYEEVFKVQLENLLDPGDLVIAISASGNSENVVRAVNFANCSGASTIGLLGFDGGKLRSLCSASVVMFNHNYGQVEDAHLVLGHIISQFLCEKIRAQILMEAGPA